MRDPDSGARTAPRVRAGAKAAYPDMAPLDRYLIPDEKVEIALARSAAPASISGAADVMVLRRDGYATVAKGWNGFVCIVARSWGTSTDYAEFRSPKMRAPHCFNPAAAKTFLSIFLKKTKLVLAGKSRAQILADVTSALARRELPAIAANDPEQGVTIFMVMVPNWSDGMPGPSMMS